MVFSKLRGSIHLILFLLRFNTFDNDNHLVPPNSFILIISDILLNIDDASYVDTIRLKIASVIKLTVNMSI